MSNGIVLHEKRPASAAPSPRQSTTPAYKYEVVNRLRVPTDTITSRSKLTFKEAAFGIGNSQPQVATADAPQA